MPTEKPQVQPTAAQAVRVVKVLKISFVVSGLLFILIAFRIPARPTTPPDPLVEVIVSLVALTNIALGFFLPGLVSRAAGRRLTNTQASTPLQRWVSGCILSLAMFMSCCLFAVVLHFIGARVRIVEILFAFGMLSIVFWKPGTPPTEDGARRPESWPVS